MLGLLHARELECTGKFASQLCRANALPSGGLRRAPASL